MSLHRLLKSVPATLLLLMVISTGRPASAEDDSLLKIQGLTLVCKGCRITAEGACEVFVDNELTLLPCENAIETLLHSLVYKGPKEGGYDGEHPSAKELRDLLVLGSPNSTTVRAALELLCRTEEGERLLQANAVNVALRYETELQTLAATRRCSSAVWDAVWRLPVTNGVSLSPRLTATLVARSKTLTLDDLLNELSVTDVDRDLRMLQEFLETLADLDSPLVQPIDELLSRVTECLPTFGADIVPERCRAASWSEIDPAVLHYLARLQTHTVISRLNEERPTPRRILAAIRTTDYDRHRTPEGHELVRRALEEIARSGNTKEREEILTEGFRPVVEAFATKDGAIARLLAEIEVAVARTFAENGEFSRTLEILKLSFLVYPERLENRSRLIDALTTHPLILADEGLKESLTALQRKEPRGSPINWEETRPIDWFRVVWLLLLTLGTVLGFSVLRTWFRRKRLEVKPLLSEEERRELQALFHYFSVPPWTPVKELTRQYHVRAKVLHPDAGGDFQKFSELTEKYQRAIELMSRR